MSGGRSMSEASEQQQQGGSAADGLTAGVILRRAREAAGLHVAALAVSLKVPVRKVEALEADRYDLLTDAVFVRALAASVCRTLKIDVQPVLDRLPQTATPRLSRVSDGINTPFRAPSDGAAPNWLDQLSKPVFLVVFALLLGALVLILLPTAPTGDQAAAPPAGEVTTVTTPPPQPQPIAQADPSPAPVVVTTAVAVPTPAPVPVPVSAAVSADVAPATPVGLSAVAAQPAAADAAPATGLVVFRAKGPSWVEVMDAKGVVAVRKVLAAGEAAGASGALPLQVTIGRADMTEVQVRGKAFDLRPLSKDNVARFEVK